MSSKLMEKMEEGLCDEHLLQTRLLSEEPLMILNQVNWAKPEPVEPSSRSIAGPDPVAAPVGENIIGITASAQAGIYEALDSFGVPGADAVAAPVAEIVIDRAAVAQGRNNQLKRGAEEHAGPAQSKFRKLNLDDFRDSDCDSSYNFEASDDYSFDCDASTDDSEVSALLPIPFHPTLKDFFRAERDLNKTFCTMELYQNALDLQPSKSRFVKELSSAFVGFKRNKKIILLYVEQNGFPKNTLDKTKSLLVKRVELW